MKKSEFDSQTEVNEDLRYIPRGTLAQNMLRTTYNAARKHDIAKTTKTKEETLKEAILQVRKNFPTFTPTYDKNYFKNL
jgi:UTP:GlnB (protein PII) uridylyltransferase